MPSSFLCVTCNSSLVHRYKCICVNDYFQCDNRGECSYYYCRGCNSEEKVSTDQIELEKSRRGEGLRTLTGGVIPPDEQRTWTDKEKSALTAMLEKVATPGCVWESEEDRQITTRADHYVS